MPASVGSISLHSVFAVLAGLAVYGASYESALGQSAVAVGTAEAVAGGVGAVADAGGDRGVGTVADAGGDRGVGTVADAGGGVGTVAAADRDADKASSVQEVVVTGSRIRSTKLQSISPITSASEEDIKLIGAVDTEAVLRDLPIAAPGRGASTNNNGNGDTSANLRNLGPQRTLVLIDGKRNVSSDSKGNVDLDIIPPGMIERIDVVTGGASAVYGADAVAGVVNVILKKDFQGAQADVQYDAYDVWDGRTADVSFIAGSNFDDGRGNVTGFAGYTNRDPVYRSSRSWAYPQLITNGTALVPYGSSTIPAGRDTTGGLMFNGSRELVPYDHSTFDNSQTQYLIVPQQRIALGFDGHYDTTPWASLYFRGTWSQNKVDRQVSSGASFVGPVSVNYGNPLLSDQERGTLFGPGTLGTDDTATFNLQKAVTANGSIGEHDTYNSFELVGGVTGPIGAHFNYDVSSQFGETIWQQVLVGDIAPDRFQQGLLVNPDGTCIDPSNGCVPIDIFTAAAGAITPDQVHFFNLTQQATSDTKQSVITGSIFGDLGGIGARSPWAKTPVGVALGAEHRRESSDYLPDDTLNSGNNVVYGSIPALSGAYHVWEVFLEGRVPLLEDEPWAKSLQLEGGYRSSHYNLAGSATTYKYGGTWQPVSDIRFRGAFERAVRAPNIGELFTSPQPESATAVDPCFANGSSGPTASATLCEKTGVPAAAYGNAALQCPGNNCRSFAGGNPNLGLEVSDSKTFGVALVPHFVPGLEVSLDYYDITVHGAIATLGEDAQPVLDNCYGSGAGQNPAQDPNNIYCRSIQRSPAGDIFTGGHNGSVGDISLLNENIGFIRVAGVDSEVNYRRDVQGLGTLAVNARVAYTKSYETQSSPELPTYECAGTYGLTCGQPIPKWRTSVRGIWSPVAPVSLSLRWRYISSVILDADRLSGDETDPPDHRLAAYSYFDLSGTWQVNSTVTLRAGVNNLFDKEPPLASRTVATASIFGFSNTFPGTYDIDRQLFVGATVRF